MAKKLDPRRKQLKALAKEIAQQSPFDDPFHGMGDFVPRDTRQNAIARVIAKLEGMKIAKPKPVAQKPKTVKRAPKKKKTPPVKKVGKVNMVMVKSPKGNEQPIPLADIREIRELLLEGWVIVGDEEMVSQAYKAMRSKSKELQSA